jgi:hypothetical protein
MLCARWLNGSRPAEIELDHDAAVAERDFEVDLGVGASEVELDLGASTIGELELHQNAAAARDVRS